MMVDPRSLLGITQDEFDLLFRVDRALADEIVRGIDDDRRLAEREELEDSLIAFFERAWREFDPAPFKLNWHHEAIAEHLEAVTRGEIRKLLINVPPRAAKTSLVNICYPAWTWAQRFTAPLSGPQVRFMCISYGATLALEIATTARRLIESPHQTRPSQLPPEERRVYIADLLARAREAIDRQRVIEAESQEVERPASDGAASNPKPR